MFNHDQPLTIRLSIIVKLNILIIITSVFCSAIGKLSVAIHKPTLAMAILDLTMAITSHLLYSQGTDRPVFWRERESGLSVAAFFVAKVVPRSQSATECNGRWRCFQW